jgi:hypothetical protein
MYVIVLSDIASNTQPVQVGVELVELFVGLWVDDSVVDKEPVVKFEDIKWVGVVDIGLELEPKMAELSSIVEKSVVLVLVSATLKAE